MYVKSEVGASVMADMPLGSWGGYKGLIWTVCSEQ